MGFNNNLVIIKSLSYNYYLLPITIRYTNIVHLLDN